jgi:hypothetical protein
MGRSITVTAVLRVSVIDGFEDLRTCIGGVEIDPESIKLVDIKEFGSGQGRMPIKKVMAGLGAELQSHLTFIGPYDHIESAD